MREKRETPRNILRNLSRVLAPTSTAVPSSSSSSSRSGGNRKSTLSPLAEDKEGNYDDDDDDDFPIERPRLSLNLHSDDDEYSELKPPRSSGLEDLDNYTATSIELPRRAWSEAPLGRLDRGSFGSVRFSDYVGPDLRSDDVGIDSGFFPPPALEDDSGQVVLNEDDMFERLDAEETRRQTLGRESLFGPIQIPEAGNESATFVMAPVELPTRDLTAIDGIQEDDLSDLDDGFQNEPMDMPELDHDNDNEMEMAQHDNDQMDETVINRTADLATKKVARRKKATKKISRHGIEYPSLPQGVVKRLATAFAKTSGLGKAKISPDTLDAIMQATDWFCDQIGDDLGAYAKHAGRKTIDESDMITLMRRQRQTSSSTTPFALAQRYLPRELLQELRMPVPPPTKVPRTKSRTTEGDGEEDVT